MRIELIDHNRKNHQDEIRRVNLKSVSNQDLKVSSQLDTLKNKRKAEESWESAKKLANTSKYPADCQIEDENDEKEEKEHINFELKVETDTIFHEDDDMEIEVEFFQCSNCDSNFLTLDNLNSHEPECDLNNDESIQTVIQDEQFPIQIVNVQTKVEKAQESFQSSYQRPNLTFNCLIALAIENSPTQTVTTHQACKFVAKEFPYFENAINHNWKTSLNVTLLRSNLFQKVAVINQGVKGTKFVYGFDLEPKSQLQIEKLIRKECVNTEAGIKSCMRRPENFSSLVSGDLCMLEEEGEVEEKDSRQGDEGDDDVHQVDDNDDDEEDKEKNKARKSEEKKSKVQLESSYQRPKLTLNCLIALAIMNSPTQTVKSRQIYKYVPQVFPYFHWAINLKWKNILWVKLSKSTLFKKINTRGKNKGRILYGFYPNFISKLRIEKIIQDEVLSNEAAIKSCMRRPEDFDNLVSGDLCLLAEETRDGIDKDKNEEEEQNLNKTQAATFKDFVDLLSTPSEIAESQSFLTGDSDDIIFEIDDRTAEDAEKNNTPNIGTGEPIQNIEKQVQEIFKVQAQPLSSYQRPNLNFNCLVALAIKNSSTHSVTSFEVIEFVVKVFPYFQNAGSHSWKKLLLVALSRSTLFKKTKIDKHKRSRIKLTYGFNSDPESINRIERLIRDQCLSNEVGIKSCMRHSGDFSRMVSGGLHVLAEKTKKEDGEDDKMNEENAKDDKQKSETNISKRKKKIQHIEKAGEKVQVQIQPQSSYQRPKLTFSCLIALAIKNSATQVALSREIYKFVANVFPYFQCPVDYNWKKSIIDKLRTSPLFKSIKTTNQSQSRPKLTYGFDSELKSQLRIENLIQEQCLNNEPGIKSCMRCPEDFSRLVSGGLGLLTEMEKGKDRNTEDNQGDDDEDEQFFLVNRHLALDL